MIVYCVPHLWEPSLLLCLSLILKQCGEPQNCPLQLQHEFITSCFALTSYISFLPFSLSFSLSLSDTLSSSLQTARTTDSDECVYCCKHTRNLVIV
ncbi:hypothetical protein S83_031682 [Arachis hypogaea]